MAAVAGPGLRENERQPMRQNEPTPIDTREPPGRQEETKPMTHEEDLEIAPSLADAKADQMTVEQWLAIRKEAGLKIDPETAEVTWQYAQILDPYGVHPDLPPECDQVGRAYFARSPGSDVWVEFGDLPDATRDALWRKYWSSLSFPAGLEGLYEALQDLSGPEKE
jgi:hypothetical protein